MGLSYYIYHAVAFLYGAVCLLVLTVQSYRLGNAKPGEKLRWDAHHRIWSLGDDEALPGLRHEFLTLKNGLQIHYVSNISRTPVRRLVVFLHGFPDSWYIYHRFLTSSTLLATGAKLVALDLPGFGGSDGPTGYGPNEMLNAIAEAIAQLKGLYLEGDDEKRFVLVGHDWGGFISYRIAAETKGLVDRVVAVNIGHMPVMRHNASVAISGCRDYLTAWSRNPMKVDMLRSARQAINPIVTQLLMSGYIFMFNLPYPLLKIAGPRPMEFLIDFCQRSGHHRQLKESGISESSMAESQASSNGPSSAECTGHDAREKQYGPSMLSRAATAPPGDWFQRIRLYREGLGTRKWTLSPELQQYRPSAERGVESFKCPLTAVFGLQDVALNPEIMLDGVERYFLHSLQIADNNSRPGENSTSATSAGMESHVIRLRDCGHWSLLEEPIGSDTLDTIVSWALSQGRSGGPGDDLEEVLRRQLGESAKGIIDTY